MKSSNIKIYLRLFKFLLPYKFNVVVAGVSMVLYALTNGALAYLLGPVTKFLFSSNAATETAVNLIPFDLFTIPKDMMMSAVPLALIFVALIKGVSSFGQSYLMGFVSQRVITDLRAKLYRHILDMPIRYFVNTPTGVLSSRLTNDVNMLQNMITDTLTRVLRQSLSIIVLACVVIAMDWKLSIAAFIGFPLVVYPLARFGKEMKNFSKKGQITMGTMTALLQEAISGIRIVKAFCMEDYESERFKTENEKYTSYQLKSIKVKALTTPLMELLGAVAFAVTIWHAAYRIKSGTLTPEAFISFFAAFIMLYEPVKALSGVHLKMQTGIAAAIRVFELIDAETEESGRDITEKIEGINDTLTFKDVNFRYEDKTILEGINLSVKKGDITAFVGMSGAGKTTLVNLIPRFYNIEEGAILIDGRNICELTLTSLRSQIAVVSQHVILFNDTIRNNIAYGDPLRDDASIKAAAKAANADTFINKLSQGYDTIIGEGGIKLSGGERQRISIARAMLKDAPILIMDEATSALDTDSEREVQKGLQHLMEGRTTFVIAHRLSTIRSADRIIVLKEGKIIETGRHDELLALNGEYSRLYTIQIHGTEDQAAS